MRLTYLNHLLFCSVSSVEIFLDDLHPTSSYPETCPSGQWFCTEQFHPKVGDQQPQQRHGGIGQENVEQEKTGKCISEHTACNGMCPSPALWYNVQLVCCAICVQAFSRCDESSQCLPEGTKCRVLLGSWSFHKFLIRCHLPQDLDVDQDHITAGRETCAYLPLFPAMAIVLPCTGD